MLLRKPLFYNEICEIIKKEQPGLIVDVLPAGTLICQEYRLNYKAVVAKGMYKLVVPESDRYYEYLIAIVFPDDYPRNIPQLICIDNQFPSESDRHIYESKLACLGVGADIYQKWNINSNIKYYLEYFVYNFLAWQINFNLNGSPPLWGQRSHGDKGIREVYKERLSLNEDIDPVLFYELLTRKNNPKGHEWCPCGSYKRIRNCHGDNIKIGRINTTTLVVKNDMKLLYLQIKKKNQL